jgi:hypothetical protein
MLSAVERPDGFTVVLPVYPARDPIGDPAGASAALRARAAIGGDVLVTALVHTSLGHYLEQLDALRLLAGD